MNDHASLHTRFSRAEVSRNPSYIAGVWSVAEAMGPWLKPKPGMQFFLARGGIRSNYCSSSHCVPLRSANWASSLAMSRLFFVGLVA